VEADAGGAGGTAKAAGTNGCGGFTLSAAKAGHFALCEGAEPIVASGEANFTPIERGGPKIIGSEGLGDFAGIRSGGLMVAGGGGSAIPAAADSGGVSRVRSGLKADLGGRLTSTFVKPCGRLIAQPGGAAESIAGSGGIVQMP
jgi:hypothetical protein